MSFLGRLFGQKAGGKVPAVAFASDAFITFDSDKALNGFATKIVQSKWPGLRLHSKAQIEGAVGFKGSEAEAKAQLEVLLQQAVDTIGLEQGQYDVEFFSVQSQMPPAKV